jgi:hypothetical protein
MQEAQDYRNGGLEIALLQSGRLFETCRAAHLTLPPPLYLYLPRTLSCTRSLSHSFLHFLLLFNPFLSLRLYFFT